MLPSRAAWPLLAIVVGAQPLHAQLFTRPGLRWETVRTSHFEVHFPHSMRPWALDAAQRLESVQGAVVRLVGNAPPHRVTVVIDDPYNLSNGAALPVLNAPTIVLWPTPPDPSDDGGSTADWVELLVVHEFAHIAHLTRPTRNPVDRVLWHVLPVDLSPIARRSPRWLMEGYATYIEGLLTGSGRPHSAARAAVLRQWAIEGRLPTYRELDGSPRFLGGDMAYLTGSAFLEWLVARSGDASLPILWRRMTARVDRDFNAAFAGVYGDTPTALYGHFTAELTGKALHAARVINAARLDTGQTFQHMTWYTGDPAVSRDGNMIAVPARTPGRATRIVVWSTAGTGVDSAVIAARQALIARDRQDVAAVHVYPAPRQPLAALDAVRGRGYDAPRFFADGRHLLVSHDEPLPDGAMRPDLFEWDMQSGAVRRITHGAAVRGADPAPDGRTALAVRCLGGVCDLVRVTLATGHVETLLSGSPAVEYNHPRFAPDGQSAVVAVHDSTGWRDEEIAVTGTGAVDRRRIGPDDGASRFAAAYVAHGSAIVTVSDLGGADHLELIDLASGATTVLTATTGGVAAPDASAADSSVYFLDQSARGRDLHRIALRAARAVAPPEVPSSFAPAAVPEPQPRTDSFPAATVGSPTPYGLGPREYRYFPGGGFGPAGRYVTLLVGSSDPVGRLAWIVEGALGDAGTWRGGAATAAWRGPPVSVDAGGFAVADFPSRASAGHFASDSLDASLQGGIASVGLVRYGSLGVSAVRAGVSVAHFVPGVGPGTTRDLAFASYRGVGDFSRGTLTLLGSVGGLATAGSTAGTEWRRLLASGSVSAGIGGFLLRYSAAYDVVNRGAPAFERPVVGGDTPPLTDVALLSQRIPALALPIGVVGGLQVLGQRLEDDVGPIAIYYDRFTTPTDRNERHDLYGGEVRAAVPPVPFLAVPGSSIVAGTAYSISTPFKYKLRCYLAIRFAP